MRAHGAAAIVVRYALAQLGKPYRWAAEGPHGFDCSGLVKASYRRAGIWVPHQTRAIAGRGRRVSRSAMRPGDVVFTSARHVGIYLGGNRMVHAPQPGESVEITTIWSLLEARRLL